MKSYYFISGLPRSGSTLLSAILRQNPDFYADIKSPILNLTNSIIEELSKNKTNLLVTEEQRKNLLYGIFEGYYKHIETPIIFDSSRLWTGYTSLLQNLFPYTKILCPVRDIVSILNSFEIIFSKNPFYGNVIVKDNQSVFSRCDELMGIDGGVISSPWLFLKEGYAANPQMIYFIEYEDLCKSPEKTMKKVYEFLEQPYFTHDFENLNYSNDDFDRLSNLKNFHTVKKKVEYYPPKNVLPPEIIQKYKDINFEFWKNSGLNSIQYN
jgi:sulfotransferase